MKKLALSALAVASLLVGVSCSNIMSSDLATGSDVSRFGARSITRTFSTAVDMFNFAADGYNSTIGPISIVKGTLKTGSTSKAVYLVGLSGTQIKSNQATGIINDFQAGFSVEGAYFDAIKKAITSYVPAGSNLVFAGHSLGGMVAQQVIADSAIKNAYVVLNTVCFGSPLVDGGSREGTVRRLGDSKDVIPYLSYSTLFVVTSMWNAFGLNREDGGYGLNVLGAHIDSYKRSDVWGRYDALGYKYGSASIAIDDATRRWFAAPSGWKFFTY